MRPGEPAAQPGQPASRRRRPLDDDAGDFRDVRRGGDVGWASGRFGGAAGSGGASVPVPVAGVVVALERADAARRCLAARRQRFAARAHERDEACGAAASDDDNGGNDEIVNHGATSVTDHRRCPGQRPVRGWRQQPEQRRRLDGLALPQPLADYGGHAIAAHADPVQGVGDFHGPLLVGHDDELGRVPQLGERSPAAAGGWCRPAQPRPRRARRTATAWP